MRVLPAREGPSEGMAPAGGGQGLYIHYSLCGHFQQGRDGRGLAWEAGGGGEAADLQIRR